MKKIFFILLLCKLHTPGYAQYFFNDSANYHFLRMIQEQNPSAKEVAFISHFIGVYAQGTNPILNAGSKNYLSNTEDSLTILKYIHDNDTLFNMYTLIEMVRNDKAVFYTYYNASVQYDKSKADSIYYYPANFLREYSDAEFQEYKKQGLAQIHMDYKNEFFKVVLELDADNHVKVIKPLGIIAYGRRNYASGDLYGYLGYGCFVFK